MRFRERPIAFSSRRTRFWIVSGFVLAPFRYFEVFRGFRRHTLIYDLSVEVSVTTTEFNAAEHNMSRVLVIGSDVSFAKSLRRH